MEEWIEFLGEDTFFNPIMKIASITDTRKLCPKPEDTFKAFKMCPPDKVRVVFLGQDPFPQLGVATGILFGNKEGTQERDISPSLQIIREAVIQPFEPSFKDGDLERFDITLESWARQGILMINSALTVEANKIGSHREYWIGFTANLMKKLSEMDKGIIFVLFGSQAASFKPNIKSGNKIIKCRHPAYYARIESRMTDAPFEEVNRLLRTMGEEPIKWLKDGE